MKMLNLICFICVIVLCGCVMETVVNEPASVTEETAAPTERPVEAREGGTLRLSMRKPLTLNPLLNEDTTVDSILKLMFMQVARLDGSMRPVPWLAEEINFASDGMSVLITLKDMYWSDGEPITSADLEFSIKTLKAAPAGAIYKECVSNILNTAIVDDRTLRINYAYAFGAADYLLCFPVIAQHYYMDDAQPGGERNMSPLGNYLYVFDSYDDRDHIKLSANPSYNGDKPYITDIDVLITSDRQTDLNAYDQSLIDALGTKLSDWGRFRGSKQTKIYEYVTTYFDFIGFNFSNKLLASPEMRQALAHGIDLDRVVEDVYHGSAVRSYTPICPQSWLYETNVVKYEFNAEHSRALYEQAIAPPPGDGEDTGGAGFDGSEQDGEGDAANDEPEIWIDSGAIGGINPIEAEPDAQVEPEPPEEFKTHTEYLAPSDRTPPPEDETEAEAESESEDIIGFVILVNEENDERVKIAGALADTINGLGAVARIDSVPFDEYMERLNNRDYDLFIGGVNLTMIPDLSFILHSSQAGSGSNYFNYKSDLMDALLSLAFGYATPSGYQAALSDLQKFIAEDLPCISVGFRKSVLLTDRKVHGDIVPLQNDMFYGIEGWYLDF